MFICRSKKFDDEKLRRTAALARNGVALKKKTNESCNYTGIVNVLLANVKVEKRI
ncbi:hypothetical protein ArsFIN_56470 (plasmid) [Arsenophonus nasoniae]|uniref:Uncharacterized protein n=1 Tax=Arsenophonus nasoniae TaxID=638 RepID=A0A4P7L3Q5_9GAMM|nr:hypothetical protein ArsFIN_56470 [Arsenophonus nasoniae]